MTIRNVVIIGILMMGTVGIFWRYAVRRSRLEILRRDVHFPTVSGTNLDRKELTFPRDFAGELNILFVPFLQAQQLVVNTWIPFVQEAESTYPNVFYYELPTIDTMPSISRTFINEGMRAGIPDQTARERTVTLYIDTEKFMQSADIPSKNSVHTLLVNRAGDILWRTTGSFSDEKGAALISAIEAHR